MTAKYTSWAFATGYAIVIVGAIVHILGYSAGFYVFCIGVLINTVSRFKLLPRSGDARTRRLNGQHFIIVACFVAAAYFMYRQRTAWALPLLIAGVVDFYLTFRYPKS